MSQLSSPNAHVSPMEDNESLLLPEACSIEFLWFHAFPMVRNDTPNRFCHHMSMSESQTCMESHNPSEVAASSPVVGERCNC